MGSLPAPTANVWFTLALDNEIRRITPGGTITEQKIPTSDSLPSDITAGPDGNLWFTEALRDQVGVVCIVLACRTHIALQGPALGLLTTTLDRAVRIGILVERIVGTTRISGGRVPLGFHREGRLRIRWDLRVNGARARARTRCRRAAFSSRFVARALRFAQTCSDARAVDRVRRSARREESTWLEGR